MDKKKIEQIAITYGWDDQCQVAIEECSELIQAICKHRRKYFHRLISNMFECPERDHIVEEIADVEIMISQLKYFLCADEEVEQEIEKKLERQIQRIKEDDYELG